MTTLSLTHCFRTTGVVTIILLLISVPVATQAEWYVAGQAGATLPSIGKGLTDVDIDSSGFPSGTTMSDRALKSSLLYGGKLGYFFPRAKWFGLETEVYNTTPHIKQQLTTINIPGAGSASGVLPGDHFRVLTWAPMNLVFRYPSTRLQPYVAIGPGVFFAQVKTTQTGFEGSQSSTKLGLNAQAGVRYYITRHVTAFGEWKYNYARFNFSENDTQFGFKATYSMNHVVFGLGYHF